MGREFHVRFCEGLGVQFPRATRLIITGTSKVLLEYGVKPLVEQFLKERGLGLSHEKTRITHIEQEGGPPEAAALAVHLTPDVQHDELRQATQAHTRRTGHEFPLDP